MSIFSKLFLSLMLIHFLFFTLFTARHEQNLLLSFVYCLRFYSRLYAQTQGNIRILRSHLSFLPFVSFETKDRCVPKAYVSHALCHIQTLVDYFI